MHPKFVFCFVFFFFGGVLVGLGFRTQGFVLAKQELEKQALYHLSHTSVPGAPFLKEAPLEPHPT
jgi:hypothetical protein